MIIRHKGHQFRVSPPQRDRYNAGKMFLGQFFYHVPECGCGHSGSELEAFRDLVDVEKLYDSREGGYADMSLEEFIQKLGYECAL